MACVYFTFLIVLLPPTIICRFTPTPNIQANTHLLWFGLLPTGFTQLPGTSTGLDLWTYLQPSYLTPICSLSDPTLMLPMPGFGQAASDV